MEALKKENKSLKSQLNYKEKARRAGFALFYAEKESSLRDNIKHKLVIKDLLEKQKELTNELPTHIINQLKEHYENTKKLCECPICLEELNPEEIQFSSCGHIYHKECYSKLCAMDNAKCALCRKKIYKKSN